jgi:HPt (histidine-containing phosphotransfer) domain-containing protein
VKKYIRLYLDAIPRVKEKINAGADTKDMEEIALQVHSFKPKWMMMGMKRVTELAVNIDKLCKENNNDVFKHIALLIEQTDKSVMELKEKC